MKIIIDLERFVVVGETGFAPVQNANGTDKHSPDRTLYVPPGLQISSIDELANSEYGQAISIDYDKREVQFGRDYLGHYPLLFMQTRTYLIISDEIHDIISWCNDKGIKLTLSAKALALYFTMGYVPQGFTL